MICDLCGQKGARTRLMNRTYGAGSAMLLIENVPVISCPNCAGMYMDAATMHELDRIKRERKHLEELRRIAVVSFGKKAKLSAANGAARRARARRSVMPRS